MRKLSLDIMAELMAARVNPDRFVSPEKTPLVLLISGERSNVQGAKYSRGQMFKVFVLLTSGGRSNVQGVRASITFLVSTIAAVGERSNVQV